MENQQKLEVWLRGPLEGIPPLLQPVAHALLQVQEELNALDKTFPTERLWLKPAGLASVGFHMQHLAGVLDRLLTYAKAQPLTENQFTYLKQEGTEPFPGCTFSDLLHILNKQFAVALDQIKRTDSATLLEIRGVGRAQIPSTHLGLLFHAAEHTVRHFGQLLVTFKILLSDSKTNIE
ncbi:DinB family protein [Dyadobacter sp. LHD-138]|uniref:DinB family protein n=1 Tax=Dyadobacter sp. LHD-138 TaxID=3071413 RepID=UPI0027E1DAE9|nr:DinB family protein [Dyadobacter sp. LHD-138]MDQ6479934.1 DinB family protein [Dyadobacter sp. LHD-138]